MKVQDWLFVKEKWTTGSREGGRKGWREYAQEVLCTFESFVKDVLLYNEHKLIKLETEKSQHKQRC